jgi:hypothetical protein
MTIDTTFLQRELELELDALALWRHQEELHPGRKYTFTIAACEKRIAELQAQLKALEGEQ